MSKQLLSPNGTPASPLAFGTMQFGGKADATASQLMYEAARDAGITHFDTAHVYTGGASETLLGQMIKADRDALLIATKAGYTGGGSRDNILTTFDQSRARLGLDTVDVLYMHRFDPDTDLRESMQTMAELRDAGQIRYVGVSNFAAWQVMKAISVAKEFDLSVDIIQPMYNLVKRQAEVELLPMCADQGVACAPYSPLGGGLLTGKYAQGGEGRLVDDERYAERYGQAFMHSAATALRELATHLGQEPATLAVAWVMKHVMGPTPIISARSVEQLKPSLAALEFDMSSALYAQMSALTPTPPPATDRTEEA